jgi:hypothetical protein
MMNEITKARKPTPATGPFSVFNRKVVVILNIPPKPRGGNDFYKYT